MCIRDSTNGQYSAQPRGEGISDINPEDIESMSVLSGPAAAALYGSNAVSYTHLDVYKRQELHSLYLTNPHSFHPFG